MLNTNVPGNSLFRSLISIFLISGIPFLCCYFLFFAFQDQINHIHRPSDAMIAQLVDAHICPTMRDTHDGIEPNILFLMFLFVGPAGFLLYKSPIPSKILIGTGLVLWAVFLMRLHFFESIFLKLNNAKQILSCALVILSVTSIVAVLRWVYSKNILIAYLLMMAVVALICFVPFTNVQYSDSAYMLAPALKILQGGAISTAYFQYDFIPSIPAWFIFKAGGGMGGFRLEVGAGLFIFIVASFFTATRFFMNKSLAFYLVALLIIMRLFMCTGEVIAFPQTTSIRLDWWLLLFAASYFWGVDNFKFGICLFLIVIFLNSLGSIYLFCYFAFLAFLLLFQLYCNYRQHRKLLLWPTTGIWVKQYALNMALGLAGTLVYLLLTGHIISEGILIYKDFQLGFLPILPNSVYWYFSAIFTFCFSLLLIFKERLTIRYWDSSLFLLFLFVGCSMWFYGRSLEVAVTMISGVLLFAVVICSDVMLQLLSAEFPVIKTRHRLVGFAPIGLALLAMMIGFSTMFYDDVRSFITNLKNHGWHYPIAYPQKSDFATITRLTQGNKKVYFMTYEGNIDFYFYLWGHYQMPAKFIPIESWLMTSEKIAFANDKLNEGYHIIAFANDSIFKSDFLPKLNYKKMAIQNRYVALSK